MVMAGTMNAQKQNGEILPYLMHKGMKYGESINRFNSTTGDSNVTLMGRWANGPCYAVSVEGNIAYFGNGGYLEIVDITNLSNPVELSKVLFPSVVQEIGRAHV